MLSLGPGLGVQVPLQEAHLIPEQVLGHRRAGVRVAEAGHGAGVYEAVVNTLMSVASS